MAKRKPTKRERKAVRTPTRVSASPLARLHRTLDIYELTAADEIIAAFRMINGQPVTRDPTLGIPVGDIRPDAADDHAAFRSDLVTAYPSWRKDLGESLALTIAEATLIEERSLTALDALYGWRKGTARKHLATALRHFAYLRRNTPRGAGREWRYVPTQQEKNDAKIP